MDIFKYWTGEHVTAAGNIMAGETISFGSWELPTMVQVGQKANLWLRNEEGRMFSIPALVAGINVKTGGAVSYDLGFLIADTDLYAVVPNVNGNVLPEGFDLNDPDFLGLIAGAPDLEVVVSNTEPTAAPAEPRVRPNLSVVPSNED